MLVPDGSKSGNITPAINKTVIKGTPRQNSIKPMEKYLITGSFERLPMASKTPRGKQKIIAKIEMTKVKNNPPHSLVSTGINPKKPPENNINDKIGKGMIKNKNKYLLSFTFKNL